VLGRRGVLRQSWRSSPGGAPAAWPIRRWGRHHTPSRPLRPGPSRRPCPARRALRLERPPVRPIFAVRPPPPPAASRRPPGPGRPEFLAAPRLVSTRDCWAV